MATNRGANTTFGVFFGVVWISGWSAATLFFDAQILKTSYRQAVAAHWPTTDGTVTSSRVVARGSRGKSYQAVIEYAYEVDGQAYRGNVVRFSMEESSMRHASRIAARYPQQSDVLVFYDPDGPALAILEPGIGVPDLYGMLFLTPFNLFTLGSWWFAAAFLRRRVFGVSDRAVALLHVRPHALGELVQLGARGRPLTWFAGALLATTSAGISLFGFTGPNRFSTPLILGYYVGCWLVAIAAALRVAWRRRRGDYDLLYDEQQGALRLPVTADRTLSRIPLTELRAVRIETVTGEERPEPTHNVLLRYRTSQGAEVVTTLGDWSGDEQPRAEALAEWIQQRVEHATGRRLGGDLDR